MRLFLGFLVAFGVGAFCRVARIPSPAPQALVGSLLVVTMSVGYLAAGRAIDRLQNRVKVRHAPSLFQEKNHARHSIQPVR